MHLNTSNDNKIGKKNSLSVVNSTVRLSFNNLLRNNLFSRKGQIRFDSYCFTAINIIFKKIRIYRGRVHSFSHPLLGPAEGRQKLRQN